MLSISRDEDTVQVEKYVNLILEVSNFYSLLENIHHIFHLISNPQKITLLKNITRISILDKSINLTGRNFLNVTQYESK